MISFLNDKFQKIPAQKFLKLGAIICFVADLLNLAYINFYFFKERIDIPFMKSVLTLNGFDTNLMSRQDIIAYKYLTLGPVSNMLILFMVYHLVVYILLIKNKPWAKKYVHGYCLSAVLLTIVELYIFRSSLSSWSIVLGLTAIMYFYVASGLRFFKKQEQ